MPVGFLLNLSYLFGLLLLLLSIYNLFRPKNHQINFIHAFWFIKAQYKNIEIDYLLSTNIYISTLFPHCMQATIRGPGLVFILPFLEHAELIDIRTKVFEVPSQQILTTDSVTLTVDAVVYYNVFDPVKASD